MASPNKRGGLGMKQGVQTGGARAVSEAGRILESVVSKKRREQRQHPSAITTNSDDEDVLISRDQAFSRRGNESVSPMSFAVGSRSSALDSCPSAAKTAKRREARKRSKLRKQLAQSQVSSEAPVVVEALA